jgi:transposase-like protein
MVAVRLYLRYNLSYRDVEELPIERGVENAWSAWVQGRPVRIGPAAS